jgi:hypothetical protein
LRGVPATEIYLQALTFGRDGLSIKFDEPAKKAAP